MKTGRKRKLSVILEKAMKLLPDRPGDDEKLHLCSLTQHNFNPYFYRHVCATSFSEYLGHPWAGQYKTLTKLDTIKF